MADGSNMATVENPRGRRTLRNIGLAAAAGLAAITAGVALRLGSDKGPSTSHPENPAATVPAAIIPTEGPKLSTPIPTETKTPEAKQIQPCTVFPTEFCSKAELLERKASDGSSIKLIGINLPSGTPIFSPVDSQVLKSELPASGVYKGKQALMGGAVVSDSSFPSVSFRGDLKFDSTSTQNAKKGDVIGYAGDAGINNFGYNVVILIGAASENAQNVEKFLKPMFPQAFEKPAKQVNADVSQPQQTSSYAGTVFN